MAKDTVFKPSLYVESLAPQLEDESFILFLRAYYEWLQSAKIIFRTKVGNFTSGETIVGDNTKAKAIVKFIGSDYLVVQVITDTPFDLNETFEGQTSNTTAIVSEIKDNIIRAASRAQKNRDPVKSVDKYFEYLKSEFNKGFPTISEVDRRLISNKLKDFYQSKSNEDAYRFLFRSVYGVGIDFRYPGEEVLRVSDGDFEKITIVRAVPTENIFSYLNQTIVGETSGSLANIVDIKVPFLGGIRFAELTLKLVSGTFVAGETIRLLEDPTETTTIYGMISNIVINDAGSGYAFGNEFVISGDGYEATAKVSSVSSGPITKIKVNEIGHGYRLNTAGVVTNTGTGGDEFSIKVSELSNTYTITYAANTYTLGEVSKVSIVNRGSNYFKAPTVTLDDVFIKSLGLLSENLITIENGGSGYSVGDPLVFTGGSGANSAGIVASVGNTTPYGTENLLFEDGTKVLSNITVNGKSSVIKNEDWNNLGSILRIELTNFGDGYTVIGLPTIAVTSNGSSASLVATNIQGNSANVEVDVANNAVGLGAIREIEITNFGIDYSNATIDASLIGDGNANLEAIIGGSATTAGSFLTDDGKISVKIIQDSLFYQDFSYVIRSGLVFNAYRELVKQTLHPVGLQFFGEILISSYLLLSAQFTTVISLEKEAIVLAIKQIISFFVGAVNPIVAETEKEFQLGPLDIWTGGILNEDGDHLLFEENEKGYHLTKEGPQNRRSIKIEIIPYPYNTGYSHPATFTSEKQIQIKPGGTYGDLPIFAREDVVLDDNPYPNVLSTTFESWAAPFVGGIPSPTTIFSSFELFIDATMGLYSDVIVMESIATVEVDIITQLDATIDETREITIQISPTSVNAIAEFFSKNDLYLLSNTEITSTLNTIEVEVDVISNQVLLDSSISTSNGLTSIINLNEDVGITSLQEEYRIDVGLYEAINNFDPFYVNSITFGDLNIYTLLNFPISYYSSKTLLDVWESYGTVKKNLKVDGTVTVVGTNVVGSNTTFDVDFGSNKSIIINDEKFKVLTVANSTHMTINVNPVGTYTNVLAYKEVFV